MYFYLLMNKDFIIIIIIIIITIIIIILLLLYTKIINLRPETLFQEDIAHASHKIDIKSLSCLKPKC